MARFPFSLKWKLCGGRTTNEISQAVFSSCIIKIMKNFTGYDQCKVIILSNLQKILRCLDLRVELYLL